MNWGSKETLIERLDSDKPFECKVCKHVGTHEYRLYQNSFTLLFDLSLFPTGKQVKTVCNNCGVTRTVKRSKTSDSVMDSGQVDDLLNIEYSKVRFYSGLVVFGAIIALIIYFLFKVGVFE